eukprot:jgi/Astpho2/4955/fgenesh1_pg.00070_%23_16_t
MPQPTGKLQIRVVRARGLKDVGLLTIQDPFVQLELGSVKAKSKVASDGGTCPDWDDTIQIRVAQNSPDALVIKVKVESLGGLSNTTVGRADVLLIEILAPASSQELLREEPLFTKAPVAPHMPEPVRAQPCNTSTSRPQRQHVGQLVEQSPASFSPMGEAAAHLDSTHLSDCSPAEQPSSVAGVRPQAAAAGTSTPTVPSSGFGAENSQQAGMGEGRKRAEVLESSSSYSKDQVYQAYGASSGMYPTVDKPDKAPAYAPWMAARVSDEGLPGAAAGVEEAVPQQEQPAAQSRLGLASLQEPRPAAQAPPDDQCWQLESQQQQQAGKGLSWQTQDWLQQEAGSQQQQIPAWRQDILQQGRQQQQDVQQQAEAVRQRHNLAMQGMQQQQQLTPEGIKGSFEANLPPRAGSTHCYAAAALGSWTNKGSQRLANSLKGRTHASARDDPSGPEERASKGLPQPGQHAQFGAVKPWHSILSRLEGHPNRKLLFLIRHGQAWSNYLEEVLGPDLWYGVESKCSFTTGNGTEYKVFDADLTEAGEQQAQALNDLLKADDTFAQITGNHSVRLVVSPLSRCLDTASLAMADLPVAAISIEELCRETLGSDTCDARRGVTDLGSREEPECGPCAFEQGEHQCCRATAWAAHGNRGCAPSYFSRFSMAPRWPAAGLFSLQRGRGLEN